MKKYLIDDHTLKKFVTKIYASEAGDQITAVVKQSKNERWVVTLIILCLTAILGRTLRSGKSYPPKNGNETQPRPRKKQQNQQSKSGSQNQSPSQLRSNLDQAHQSEKQRANQNQPVRTTRSPEPKFNQTKSPPPSPPPSPTTQTGITASDVKKIWTDLKDPISYSGNSANILNRIKSFQ